MPLQLFLNSLSTPTVNVHREQAIGYLKGLVSTTRAARTVDSTSVLNCEEPLNALALGGGFTVASLRNGGECVDEALFLKTLSNRAPLSHVIGEANTLDPDGFEYRIAPATPNFGGTVVNALGLAHGLKGLAISLPTDALWCKRKIPLELSELLDDGSIRPTPVDARNATTPDDVLFHEPSLQGDLRPPVHNGADLWAQRAVLFPYLEFIPRTRGQIEGILVGDPLLDQLWIKLDGISRALADWSRSEGPHPIFPFNVRPESRSRMGLTWFNDAAGVSRSFSDHADLAPTEARLHFIVLAEPRRHALIGHVGRKLGIG